MSELIEVVLMLPPLSRRFAAVVLVAAAVTGASVDAAEPRGGVRHAVPAETGVHSAPAQLRPVDAEQPGILIAPNCPGGCGRQNQPGSVIDWLRAQVTRLVA